MEGGKKPPSPKHLIDAKGFPSFLKTRRTMVFAYGFMVAFILCTGFLALGPSVNSSVWFSNFLSFRTNPPISSSSSSSSSSYSLTFSSIFSYIFPVSNPSSANLGPPEKEETFSSPSRSVSVPSTGSALPPPPQVKNGDVSSNKTSKTRKDPSASPPPLPSVVSPVRKGDASGNTTIQAVKDRPVSPDTRNGAGNSSVSSGKGDRPAKSPADSASLVVNPEKKGENLTNIVTSGAVLQRNISSLGSRNNSVEEKPVSDAKIKESSPPAVPSAKHTTVPGNTSSPVTATPVKKDPSNAPANLDYGCSVEFFRSPFLVQEWETPEPNGTTKETLRLDLIEKSSSKYKNADILVFNTGHWWTHEKTSKGKDYYQEGNHVYSDLDVHEAYRKALKTWAKWVDANVDPKKTLVFFRGYSSSHFSGGQWNSGGQCDNETEPITKDAYLSSYPPKMKVLESVLNGMKTPISYLNITRMTDYRKDAHPSIYSKPNLTDDERRAPERFQDCSHWCLPGLPETWNELLYAKLVMIGK
ncbi:trichome birefringence-like 1 protein [Nymphaea thermarum]|nr:trichome birefringence-like 1 protein [Nymphaea thermarum]